MEKTYKYENATIRVTSSKSCSREELIKSTTEFMKKVIYGGKKNDYTNTTRNLNKK
jgi:hypothetical protein